MKATEILIEEHQIIEPVLTALERATKRLSSGEDVSALFFNQAIEFIKGFVDECHHTKEEKILFPAMIENGVSREASPVAVMLAEHAEGRRLTRLLGLEIEHLQAGDAHAREEIVKIVTSYVRLLRQHIFKENNILFPMADKVIPLTQHATLADSFERTENEEIGEGVHEKYQGLAERLEKESFQ